MIRRIFVSQRTNGLGLAYRPLPSGPRAKVERYVFRLTYAMRSLPDDYAKSVVKEIRSAIEEGVEHHLEAGYAFDEAYDRVLADFMAPEKLGKKYVAAHQRRLAAFPEVSEAVLLFASTASAAVFTVQTAHSPIDLTLALATAFVSLTSVLRLVPLTRMLRIRKAAARIVKPATWIAAPAASLPALLAIHAQFTVSLWPASFVAHFSLNNLSTSALLSVGTLFVLARNRRVLEEQDRVMHVVTHDRVFADNYFRVTAEQREEEIRFGYFTETVD